jgi:hypothetical protein
MHFVKICFRRFERLQRPEVVKDEVSKNMIPTLDIWGIKRKGRKKR